MEKKSGADIFRQLIIRAGLIELFFFTAIFFFTKNLIYSIISLAAAAISILGFIMMIILIDRLLQRGKGRLLFLSSGLAKIVVISIAFFLVARISETAVLCFILGISVVALAATAQGIGLLFRGLFHGT